MPRIKTAPSPQAHTTIAVVENNPAVAINSPERFSQFMAAMREQIGAHVPDTSTTKGRQEIIALAFKVTKSKTALEGAAKRLKEEAQETVNKVNASIRTIREELDAYAIEVRAPVTEWETNERGRQAKVDQAFGWLRGLPVILASETSKEIFMRLEGAKGATFSKDTFQDRLGEAQEAFSIAIESLTLALKCAEQEESDRAELETLRAQKAEADLKEQQRFHQEREASLQRQREKDELAAAKAREAQQQADAKRREAEERQREAQAKKDAEAAEKRRHVEMEAAKAQAAADALKKAEAAAQAEALVRQQEADRRAADTANRKRVTDAVASCLTLIISPKLSPVGKNVTKTTPELLAQAITQALVEGAVPHCTLKF